MIFFTVFVVSFLSADYLITGSVTNTWIGIAIVTGTLAAVVRRLVIAVVGEPKYPSPAPSSQPESSLSES